MQEPRGNPGLLSFWSLNKKLEIEQPSSESELLGWTVYRSVGVARPPAARKRELSAIELQLGALPPSRSSGNVSASMLGPVVGSRRTEPSTEFLSFTIR